jgi:hypothetical protein
LNKPSRATHHKQEPSIRHPHALHQKTQPLGTAALPASSSKRITQRRLTASADEITHMPLNARTSSCFALESLPPRVRQPNTRSPDQPKPVHASRRTKTYSP